MMSTGRHTRLRDWWQDDPAIPDRPTLADPAVQPLIQAIDPSAEATDLGGVMSLNARLLLAGLVLRVHQPWVSRPRLLALQAVRQRLAGQGLIVPTALPWNHTTVFRCGSRWAELERYIPHAQPPPTLAAYAWMFRALGRLHWALAKLDLSLAWRSGDDRSGVVATPLLFPYVNLPCYLGLLAVVAARWPRWGLAAWFGLLIAVAIYAVSCFSVLRLALP